MAGEKRSPMQEAMDRLMTTFQGEMGRFAATSRVLTDIRKERVAQDERWGEQNHPDAAEQRWNLSYPSLARPEERREQFRLVAEAWKARNAQAVEDGTLDWAGILAEEVFEALAESDPALLRAELVQVAAVAVCQIEHIDRREAKKTGRS